MSKPSRVPPPPDYRIAAFLRTQSVRTSRPFANGWVQSKAAGPGSVESRGTPRPQKLTLLSCFHHTRVVDHRGTRVTPVQLLRPVPRKILPPSTLWPISPSRFATGARWGKAIHDNHMPTLLHLIRTRSLALELVAYLASLPGDDLRRGDIPHSLEPKGGAQHARPTARRGSEDGGGHRARGRAGDGSRQSPGQHFAGLEKE